MRWIEQKWRNGSQTRRKSQRGAPAHGGAGFGEARSRGPAERGCAPDPVREAPVREGAHKAAIDIREAGRIASAPASEPSANRSQPHSVAERKRTATKPNLCALPGSDPHGTWGPSSAVQCAPRSGDATRWRDAFALGQTRACAHLHGRIPKGAPVPRSGAYTSREFVTKYGVNSRRLLCR